MTNIDIAKGLIFQALKISKDTFDDRLVSQKKIYLLQELGLDIGYAYNWYIRGPYSSDLTSYIFNNLDMLKEQDLSKYQISNFAQQTLDIVNSLENQKPASLSVPSWYELLASVLYIIKNWGNSNAYESLIEHKPQYNKEEYDKAVEAIKSAGFTL